MEEQVVSESKGQDSIIKSESDKRDYRVITLPNKLQAILISDATTDKASAAMSVNVGFFSDPEDLPGLAHFLEHMLFLGTEKYPDENSYSSYLTEHGGQSNAFTDQEDTNYFFDVGHQFLEGALDRFSQFFIAPLFTQTATDREMQAVDSESSKNLQQDNWRMNQLSRATANPGHPYHKFGTGNLKTLRDIPKEKGIDVRAELLKFHATYYSANRMKLAIFGRENLDTLQKWVEEKFSAIKNTDREECKWNSKPFEPEHLQMKFNVCPVQKVRMLNVFWPVPPFRPHYRKKPENYVSHLLGHEGPGSILSLLKNNSWATALVAGPSKGGSDFSTFRVSMDITEEGLAHAEEIVKIIYQYLNLLRNAGPQRWIFDESKLLADVQFRFKDNEEPFAYTMALALSLQMYEKDWVLAGPYLFDQFDADLISDLVGHLVPENMRYEVVSKDFDGKTTTVEPWYQTPYSMEKIPAELLKEWNECGLNKDLALPPLNEFVPSDFSLRCKEERVKEKTYPILLEDSEQFKIWYKLDNVFDTPKTVIFIEFRTPIAYQSPKSHVMTDLFVKLVSDSLNEYAYAADLTGLEYKLDPANVGMQLASRGYSHKQPILLEKILHRIADLHIDPDRFAVLKEKNARTYHNFKMGQAYTHALYHISLAIEERRWNVDEYSKAIETVTVEDMKAFIPTLLSSFFYECLFHGNISKEEAFALRDVIVKALNAKPLQVGESPTQRIVSLPDKSAHWLPRLNHNSADTNTAIENYYQIGRETPRTRILLEIVCQLIKDPVFNVLRTQEQLGYLVHSGLRTDYGVLGLRIIIQSEKDPQFLDERAEAFLATFPKILEELSAEEFQNHINALILIKLQADKQLEQESGRYWKEIINHSYRFDREIKEVELLKEMTKESVLNFYETFLAKDAPKRRKIASHIYTENSTPKEEGAIYQPNQRITDFIKFKDSMYLFPYPACAEDD